MSKTRLHRRHRTYCLGDLEDYVTIHRRTLGAPKFGTAEATEEFEGLTNVPAAVETTAGSTFFDGVNGDVRVSHKIGIRYDVRVTAESWIELDDGTLLDIVDAEDLERRKEWLVLRCVERGDKDQKAAQA